LKESVPICFCTLKIECDAFLSYFRPVVYAKVGICMGKRFVVRREPFTMKPIGRDIDAVAAATYFQPDIPLLPGKGCLRQSAGRQQRIKYCAVKVTGINGGNAHRAGKGAYDLPGNGNGFGIVRALKIQ